MSTKSLSIKIDKTYSTEIARNIMTGTQGKSICEYCQHRINVLF